MENFKYLDKHIPKRSQSLWDMFCVWLNRKKKVGYKCKRLGVYLPFFDLELHREGYKMFDGGLPFSFDWTNSLTSYYMSVYIPPRMQMFSS